jgi:hypothetical protein
MGLSVMLWSLSCIFLDIIFSKISDDYLYFLQIINCIIYVHFFGIELFEYLYLLNNLTIH